MDKNKKILNCILGSVFLVLLNSPLPYGCVSQMRYGDVLGDILNLISFLGVILTITFSIILIKENCNYKEK